MIGGQIFGALGKSLVDMGALPGRLLGDEEVDLRRVPVLRKYTAFPSNAQENAVYHDRAAQVLTADKVLRAYEEGPRADPKKAVQFRRENRKLLNMVEQTKDVDRQLKSLRKRMKLAENRGDQNAAKRFRDRMDTVRARYNEAWLRRVAS